MIRHRAGDAQLATRRLELLTGVSILPLSREILKLAEDLVVEVPIPRKAAVDTSRSLPFTAASTC
jgi:hypothetical protein